MMIIAALTEKKNQKLITAGARILGSKKSEFLARGVTTDVALSSLSFHERRKAHNDGLRRRKGER
jgi:hypothetical protein